MELRGPARYCLERSWKALRCVVSSRSAWMAATKVKGWSRRFDDPIPLPDGGTITTLQQAIAWLARSIPEAGHSVREVQAAAYCVTEAAESNGPMIFARIGMMQAIRRHRPRIFNPSRKDPHW